MPNAPEVSLKVREELAPHNFPLGPKNRRVLDDQTFK